MDQGDNDCTNEKQRRAIPGIGLVDASVFLAVFLEVIPVEADAIHPLITQGRIVCAIIFKMLFLTLIFMPLIVYVSRNGMGALKIVRGRVAIICLITFVHLIGTLVLAYGYVFYGGAAMPK